MNRLEDEYDNQIKFLYLDANGEGKSAFEAGNFRGHPAFVLMSPAGEELWRQVGVVSFGQIEDIVMHALE